MAALKRRSFLNFCLRSLVASLAPVWVHLRPSEVRALPQDEFRYVRWSWKRWLEITRTTPPSVRSDQSGRLALVDLLQLNGRPITSTDDWERKRRQIVQILTEFVGEPPSVKPPLNPRLLEERRFVDYVRRKIVFTSEPGEEIPAYLFVPTNADTNMPAVLTPHQTTYDGKLEPAGIRGEPSLWLATQLAERGYVTLAADAICFGERHEPSSGHYGDAIEFYYRHPNWSILGKMNWDKKRAVDYLQSLEFVDPERIGVIGHSHGAYGSLWAAAFDPRIRVVVASGAFDTFRSDGNTWRWSHATALLPKLGFYLGEQADNMTLENFQDFRVEEVAEVPFDYHHLLSLLAPRPVFYAVALQDEVFPHADGAQQALAKVEEVYRLYGAADRLSVYTFDGGHSFPAGARREAFDWLDRWL